MSINDQIENLKEKFQEQWQNIQESPTYNSLREKYEVLPTSTQKALKTTLVLAIVLLMTLIPLGYYQSSSSNISDFEEKREQIRSLLKASAIGSPDGGGVSFDVGKLKSRVEGIINSSNLLSTQIGEIKESTTPNTINIGTKKADISGVSVSLTSLNLNEIVNIGYQLQSIDKSVKLTGLRIQATQKNDHYFNVDFTVKSFSLPLPKPSASGDKDSKGKSKRRTRRDK